MKKLLAIIAIIGLAPAGLGFGPPALIESEQALAPLLSGQVAAIEHLESPVVSAASAMIADGQSGMIVYAKDPNSRRAMASLTKMMTALLALEMSDLSARVRVTIDASQLGDSSVMGLRSGEELTLEDLLYGLLLPSGNDAALAIAQFIGGSEPPFVALMNGRAASLGLSDTHFVNPHGLDAPGHYSSALDLAKLARVAYGNETFAKIVGTKERTIIGKLATYRLLNTNQLLGSYPGLDGIKTGTTDAAGECFVSTAQKDDERVFTVVLGSSGRFTDTSKMLDYFYRNFRCQRLPQPASPFYGLAAGPAIDVGEVVWSRMITANRPWDCRPVWQLPWIRAELSFPDWWDGERSAPTIRYFAGNEAITSDVVQRQ